MPSDFFKNKVAIITGSSQGIGQAIAIELLKQGANVVINGRHEQKLLKAKEQLAAFGAAVLAISGDVSDPEEAEKIITKTIGHFGKLDILINNAGLSMQGPLAMLNPQVYKKVFEANVLGSVNPTIPALPHLRAAKGSVVFISSVAGIRGLPGYSAYSSSKMALRGIAEALRIEESSSDLHVGLLYVGFTENEPEKRTLDRDGNLVAVSSRSRFKQQPQQAVAQAVLLNIRKRKFISTLSFLGKLNKLLQSIAPNLVERILIRAYKNR